MTGTVKAGIDFNTPLKNLRGEELKDITDGKEQPITLKTVCVEALLTAYPKEEISGTEKMKRYRIAKKVDDANGEVLQLSVEELKSLKELVGIRFSPLIVGAAYAILDPTELTEK